MKIRIFTIILLIIFSSCGLFETEPELFSRPFYEIRDIETDLYGKWYIIEITESVSKKTHYPPTNGKPTVTFCKSTNEIEWDFSDFKFDLPFEANFVNIFMSSFKNNQDSINISEGRQTVMYSEKSHWMQFEELFFSALINKRFEIQIDRNILKLSNENADLLFYK